MNKQGRFRPHLLFAAVALAALGLGVAVGAVVYAAEYAPQEAPLNVPEWLWASLFAGAVQGLVWFGAVNSKMTWLMSRLDTLEKRFNRHIEHPRHREADAGD